MKKTTHDWKALKPWIIRLYKDGLSLDAVAEEIGRKTGKSTSKPTVTKYLSRWGVKRRGRNRSSNTDHVGERHGRFRVVALVEGTYPTTWLCECACGRFFRVRGDALKHRITCGCRIDASKKKKKDG